MSMRQHEIALAHEIADLVVHLLKRDGEVDQQPLPPPGGLTRVQHEPPTNGASERPPALEPHALGDVVPPPEVGIGALLDAGTFDASEFMAATPNEAALVEALGQLGNMLEETAALLEQARAERGLLRASARDVLHAHGKAFEMFDRLRPLRSDGQQVLYPLRGEHLAKFKLLAARVDELGIVIEGIKS